MKAEVISVYAVGTVILSALVWGYTEITPKADFDQHVADKQCERATDRWITAANNLDKRPEDQSLKKAERQASSDKEQQCKKTS